MFRLLTPRFFFSLSVSRGPLITPSELIPHLSSNLKIINSSFLLPPTTGDPKEVFKKERLPNARFFGLDDVCDKAKNLPHMLPSLEVFEEAMKKMDVGKKDVVVVYDDYGIVGACRGWYTFKFFGLENVYILNGGLLKWKNENLALEQGPPKENTGPTRNAEEYKFQIKSTLQVADLKRVQEASFLTKNNKGIFEILDARGEKRFKGEEPEPRAGLRSGNIAGSKNLFYKKLLNDDWTFKSNEELTAVFAELKVDPKKFIINSCGSGMTAAVLYVAEELLGYSRKAIYDGSWTEYGAVPLYNDAEIEKGISETISPKFIPSHITLEAGKQYSWCTCGRSLNQPFCDGQHIGTEFKSLKFTVDKTKSYNICRCKGTKNSPFCDFSHVGQALKYVKKNILG